MIILMYFSTNFSLFLQLILLFEKLFAINFAFILGPMGSRAPPGGYPSTQLSYTIRVQFRIGADLAHLNSFMFCERQLPSLLFLKTKIAL